MNPFDVIPKPKVDITKLTHGEFLREYIKIIAASKRIQKLHQCEPVNVGFSSVKLVCKHCDKEL